MCAMIQFVNSTDLPSDNTMSLHSCASSPSAGQGRSVPERSSEGFCVSTVRARIDKANRAEIARTQEAPEPASCSKGILKRLTRREDAPASSESKSDIQTPHEGMNPKVRQGIAKQHIAHHRIRLNSMQQCTDARQDGNHLFCLQSEQVAHRLCDRQHKNLSRLSGKGYGESVYKSDTGMVGRISV